jgi:predicted lipid-binding transport protein (Tim44 family)
MAKGRSSALRFLVITFRIFLIVVGYSMIPAGMERIADAEPPYQAMQQFWGQLSIMIGAVVGVLSLGIVIGLFFRQRWAAWIAFI